MTESSPLPSEVDFLVVGSGLSGSVIARTLADAGRQVHVVERRDHLGGNVHDQVHQSGIRFHTYGPHYFRTSSPELIQFVQRFSPFYRFEARLKTRIDGKYEDWPVTRELVGRLCGPDWTPAFSGRPENFEEASLAKMPRRIYELFVDGYTQKQWGVNPATLSADLASRFQLGREDDPRLVKHTFQGLPTLGYSGLMRNMLEGIPVTTGVDYLRQRDRIQVKKRLIFTGPIDEYFDFDLGRLHYRGQQRQHDYLENVDEVQPVVQVNYPSLADAKIRVLEWKHLQPPDAPLRQGTLTTTETPWSPGSPDGYEYPFPDAVNQSLYSRYRDRVDPDEVLVCGRLGEYRYYDMDQAIARAQLMARRLLEQS